MAYMEESKSNQLANTAAKLAALKRTQSLKEAPVLPAEAIGDLKDNIREAQHLAV